MGSGLLPYKLQGPARLIRLAWVGYPGPVGKNKLFCISWDDFVIRGMILLIITLQHQFANSIHTQVNSDCYKERSLELEYCWALFIQRRVNAPIYMEIHRSYSDSEGPIFCRHWYGYWCITRRVTQKGAFKSYSLRQDKQAVYLYEMKLLHDCHTTTKYRP
jgi:hypothetical protein